MLPQFQSSSFLRARTTFSASSSSLTTPCFECTVTRYIELRVPRTFPRTRPPSSSPCSSLCSSFLLSCNSMEFFWENRTDCPLRNQIQQISGLFGANLVLVADQRQSTCPCFAMEGKADASAPSISEAWGKFLDKAFSSLILLLHGSQPTSV